MKCLQFWKDRTNHDQYFVAYDVGKSITRVIDGVIPHGVHTWKLPSTTSLTACTSIADVRNLDLQKYFKYNEAIILHYIVGGFQWWFRKYQILDLFPNHWFGGRIKIDPCFHRDSRDIYLSGDLEEMKKFYRSQIVLDNKNEIEEQITSGLCTRILEPSTIIKKNYPEKIPTTSQQQLKESQDLQIPISLPKKPTNQNNTLPLEKMWMISSLVSQYLNKDTPNN